MKLIAIFLKFIVFAKRHYHNVIAPTVIVHGGVGSDMASLTPNKLKELKKAVMLGYRTMMLDGNVIDAVEEAMNYMEESPEFNIGIGSMLNSKGEIEMDASIMDGKDLRVGAVGCAKNVLHPTTLARGVMEFTPHILICAEGTQVFARRVKTPCLSNEKLATDTSRKLAKTCDADIGNAGVIAMNNVGHVAAAAGGAGKSRRPAGSVTEAARVGCGIYADNSVGGVVVTGDSEFLLRNLLAYNVYKSMLDGKRPIDALKEHLECMKNKFKSGGGGIAISKNGDLAVLCTTPQMAWAYQRGDNIYFGLNNGEKFSEKICL